MRARIRKRTLLGLAALEERNPTGSTATEVRKFIRGDYPVGLNPVSRAIREMGAQRLVTCVGVTELRALKRYRLTTTGRAIARQLLR